MAYFRLIVNPIAGAGKTARIWPHINDLLKNMGLKFEYDFTEAPGHAVELAKSAARGGHELVVSVGGDGTINEVVNGLYEAGGIGDVSLGMIGTGTGGDYIRSVGVPRHYREACQRLMNPSRHTVDLGLIEYAGNGQMVKRLFTNFAGLGFDAEVVKATTQRFKAMGSVPSYLLGLLTTFLSYRNTEVLLKLDGKTESRKVCSILASNGRYGGGSMLIAPHADLTDGLFDVLIIDDLSKADLLWSLPRIYRGTHLTHPKVNLIKAREIEIQPRQHTSIQADGELLGSGSVHLQILPAALNLVVSTLPDSDTAVV